jgi:hypothetical protein
MRNVIAFARAALLVALGLVSRPALADLPITGDLTFDRLIDIRDFNLLHGHLLGTTTLSPTQLAAADIDHDGVVTRADLIRGMRAYGRYVHFEVPPFDPYEPGRPVVQKAMPAFGPAGTIVTLIGSGFGLTPSDNVVRFAGVPVSVHSASATSVTFQMPDGAESGSVTIEVGGLESCGVPFLVGSEPPLCNPGAALAPADIGLVLPSEAVAPGTRITIPIAVDTGDHDVVGVDLRVTFDPTVLRAVEMEMSASVRYGRDFYRCIDNTTGVVAAAFGVNRTPAGRPLEAAELVFDVVGQSGRVGVVGGRLNAFVDLARTGSIGSGAPRFLASSQSFVHVSDGSYSELVRLLPRPLVDSTASVLSDGRVLIAGGRSERGRVVRDACFFDPATGEVTPSAHSMIHARRAHTATVLPDGRVVLAGGVGSSGVLDTVEIFDPATGRFRVHSERLSEARAEHATALLADGRVAWFGGRGTSTTLASVEIFDPSTDTIYSLPAPLVLARRGASVVSLSPVRLLVSGGEDARGRDIHLRDSEIYEIDAGRSSLIGQGTGSRAGMGHRYTQLLSSRAVVVTGEAEVAHFDPDEGEYDDFNDVLQEWRTGHFAVPIAGDRVLVGGGFSAFEGILRSTEIVTVQRRSGLVVTVAGPRLLVPRAEAAAVSLPDGRVVVAGGTGWNGEAVGVLEVLRP